MGTVIDAHAHIFPASLEKHLPVKGSHAMNELRNRMRGWIRPVSSTLHRTQPLLRYLPETARKNLDFLSGLAPLAGLFIESTASDLVHAMDDAKVDRAIIIAHPPVISNELILEAAAKNPRFIPAVNLPRGTSRPSTLFKDYVKKGAKLLKIHPASDGEGPDSRRYKSLLQAATDLGVPVIIHTGCIHSHLLYKEPKMGHAELFRPWFKAFPETRFILAHMNFHEPHVALDLAVENPNLFVDTSWQPVETIGEAVRRIGAERVLFGTDWPIIGNNLWVGRKRIRQCLESGLIDSNEADLILGKNAERLLAHAP